MGCSFDALDTPRPTQPDKNMPDGARQKIAGSIWFGGIQLVRTQKIGIFLPPPPSCTHFHTQRPDSLPFNTYSRPDPPHTQPIGKMLRSLWVQLQTKN